ncbi:TPA: hypothetical protein N0F65_009834 [Lagenidium giganteum]|uniref:EF-hand domain-containing protein n=1 Tax=Lagenidium giganteum TaxID=4803 RepID=A0AAV2YUD5_9STRA|nr:TPA: hypothetical protein N0F65_009834 [Lagenidium giganteum]
MASEEIYRQPASPTKRSLAKHRKAPRALPVLTPRSRQRWLQDAQEWHASASLYLDLQHQLDGSDLQLRAADTTMIESPSLLTAAEHATASFAAIVAVDAEPDRTEVCHTVKPSANVSPKSSPVVGKSSSSPLYARSDDVLVLPTPRKKVSKCSKQPARSPRKLRVEPLLSEEMRAQLHNHVQEQIQGDMWSSEVRSRLARPLSASTFCGRDSPQGNALTAPKFQPNRQSHEPVVYFPYSKLVHDSVRKVARCRAAQKAWLQLLAAARALACKLRFVRRFCFPQLIQSHRRRMKARVAIQRCFRRHHWWKQVTIVPISLEFVSDLVARGLKLAWARRVIAMTVESWYIREREVRRHMAWRRRCLHRWVAKTRVCRFVHMVWVVQWFHRKRCLNIEEMERELRMLEQLERQVRVEYDAIFVTNFGKQLLKKEHAIWRATVKAHQQPLLQSTNDSPAAALHGLQQCFRLFDLDNSGTMDLDEFQLMLSSLRAQKNKPKKRKLTVAQTRDLFESLDEDGNGRISFDEFAAWWEDNIPVNSSSAAVTFLANGLESLIVNSRGLLFWLLGRKDQLEKRFVKKLLRKRAMEKQKRDYLDARNQEDTHGFRCPRCGRRCGLRRDSNDHVKQMCTDNDVVVDCYILARWVREEKLRVLGD